MAPNRYRGPPMTLANMRENGVRSLSVTCELCHHDAVMNVDAFGDAVPVLRSGLAWSAPSAASSAHSPGRFGRSEPHRRARPDGSGGPDG
jgi:hypothetical protein